MSTVVLGPILYARPSTATEWRFEVHVTVVADDEGPPAGLVPDFKVRNPDSVQVTVGGPHLIHRFSDQPVRVWAWDVAAPRDDDEKAVWYQLDGDEHGPVAIPSRFSLPRFAFFSCNGFSDPADVHKVPNPQAMWEDLNERHQAGMGAESADDLSGINLLIGGGDQIYCDALWHREPLLGLSRTPDATLSPDQDRSIRDQYLQWYQQQWGYAGFATAMSSIPCVFTWDDHDIFDGWGSHPADRQKLRLHQAVFRAARETFSVFQVGGEGSPLLRRPGSHNLQVLDLESESQQARLVLPDLRGDRTICQVLSKQQWDDLVACLTEFRTSSDERESYLLLVSSIPVVYRRTKLEGIPVPSVEDDRRDQWEHGSRRGERARLILNLLDAAGTTSRAAVISGDVHVASRGRIVSSVPAHRSFGADSVVHQVTASAIVHPAPTLIEWLGLKAFSHDDPEVLSDGIVTEVLGVTAEEKYVRARNYVLGTFTRPQDGNGALWFQWIRERTDNGATVAMAVPEQLVVRGVPRTRAATVA